jgi:hypothetical protein
MPASYPDFPSARQMCAYYDAYADQFGLRAHIRFGARVTATRYRPDERWDVTFDDGTTSTWKSLIVCNGHHWAKALPAWTDAYTGRVLHSKDYKHPDELRGERVLVLGGGNSGCDVVSEAARVGASADWSLRRGYWFMPKTLFGRPTIEMMKPWLPPAVQRAVVRACLRVAVGPYTRYGLPEPDHAIFDTHPTVSTEVFHYLSHGRIRPRPDVDHADGDTIVFTDGARARYDLVVCATGYDVALPFLPEGAVPVIGKTPQLYAGMTRPEYRHLYVVGAFQARYGIGPLLRPLAVFLGALLDLQDALAVPLGALLKATGQRPPTTHLVDPHAALRRLRLGRRMLPILRWRARKLGMWGQAPPLGPSATDAHDATPPATWARAL